MNIYDIIVEDNKGNDVSLNEYRNKVLLIVNTATSCGLTPQYNELQNLYEKYNSQGFEVLDFPCSQFANQTKGSDSDINTFCTLNYNTTFKRFKKITVNGANESVLFTFLKSKNKGILSSKIKWNFTKFLVDKNGNVVARYSPQVKPSKIEKDIKDLLE